MAIWQKQAIICCKFLTAHFLSRHASLHKHSVHTTLMSVALDFLVTGMSKQIAVGYCGFCECARNRVCWNQEILLSTTFQEQMAT